MKKLVIVKTGETFPSIAREHRDFEDWIFQGLDIETEKVKIVDVLKGQALPAVEKCSGVVIAGSHAMVTQDLVWSLAIEQWVPTLIQSDIPLLGICFGHQLIARAMGGIVDYHARGMEIGTAGIELVQDASSDRLFTGFPEKFSAHVFHSQTVVRLPDTAVRVAKNDFEPNHAFRIGNSAWGVQFHPEYDDRIMAGCAENSTAAITDSGLILSDILEQIGPTPIAANVLKQFGKLAG